MARANTPVILAARPAPREAEPDTNYDLRVDADMSVGLDPLLRAVSSVTVGRVTITARHYDANNPDANKIVLDGGLPDLRLLRDVLDQAIASARDLEMAPPVHMDSDGGTLCGQPYPLATGSTSVTDPEEAGDVTCRACRRLMGDPAEQPPPWLVSDGAPVPPPFTGEPYPDLKRPC